MSPPAVNDHPEEAAWTDPYDAPSPWREWVKMALVLLLAAAAFTPALFAGWAWKDHDFVQLDETPGSFAGIAQHWINPKLDDVYRPVAHTSYWIQYTAWEGAMPLAYHAVGIAFHLLNVLVLWRILVRLEIPSRVWIVALFAVHPICAQSVSWVSQQPVVMSTAFCLLSMWFWLRLVKIEPPTPLPLVEHDVPEWRRASTYILSLGFFLLALLTEPAVCAFPVIMILITRSKKGKLTSKEINGLAPLVIASALVLTVVIWAQASRPANDHWTPAPLFRALIAARALWFHAGKIACPWPLVFVYPRWAESAVSAGNLAGIAGAIAIAVVLLANRKKIDPAARIAIAAFILLLIPWFVLTNLSKTASFVGDFQQYFAAIGLIAVAATLLANWAQRAKMLVSAQYIAAAIILCVLAGISYANSSRYASAQGLWEQTLAYNPNSPVANYELGNLLLEKQKFEPAEKYLAKAVQLRPNDSQAILQYGTVLERQAMQLAEKDRAAGMKKLDQAETLYRAWSQKNAAISSPFRCLAGVENLRGNRAAAIPLYEKALQIDPKDDVAENNLATAMAREGRVDDAMKHYERALELNPKLVQAHLNMAGLLFGMRKNPEAFAHIEQALKADRSNFDAYMSAGGVCMQMKLFNDASRMFRRATSLRTDSPNAWNALGCALAAQNQLDEAVECFGRALDLKPEYEDARANLASAKKQRG